MLENTLNQPSKFRTKNWVEVNDKARAIYNVNSKLIFKIYRLRSILCGYSDPYIFESSTTTVRNRAEAENKQK